MDIDILHKEFVALKRRVEPMLKEYEQHVASRAQADRAYEAQSKQAREGGERIEGQPIETGKTITVKDESSGSGPTQPA